MRTTLPRNPRPPSTSPAGHREDDYEDCTAPPTPEQQAAADKLVADTKVGVAKYVDLSVARADGYQLASPPLAADHKLLQPTYERDGAILDPDRPEALVYANTSKGAVC